MRRAIVSAGKVEFQLNRELEVLPVEAFAALKWPTEADTSTLTGVTEVLQVIEENLDQRRTGRGARAPLRNQAARAAGGGCPAPKRWLWLRRRTEPCGLRCSCPKVSLGPTRRRTSSVGSPGEVLSVGVHLDASLCGVDDHQRCPDPGARA